MALTQDGLRAVSGSYDNTLKLWDLTNGRELRTFTGHSGSIKAVAIFPDGQRFVSASDDTTLKVWDVQRGSALRTLCGHVGSVDSVAISPNGLVLSGSYDRTVRLWDKAGKELSELRGHDGGVGFVAFAPNERYAFSLSGAQLLKWDLQYKPLPTERKPINTSFSAAIRVLRVTPNGRIVVAGSADGRLELWNLSDGTRLFSAVGHSGEINDIALIGEGRIAVSASEDGTLKLWSIAGRCKLGTLGGHARLNTKNWFSRFFGKRYPVCSVAVTRDGCRAVSGSIDQTIKYWDLERRSELQTFVAHRQVRSDGFHFAGVGRVLLTPDGRFCISGSLDGTVEVWDLQLCCERHRLLGYSGLVTSISLTPDGGRLVSAGQDDGKLIVWNLADGDKLHTLSGHSGQMFACEIMPDGRAVSASGDGTLKVWDLERGSEEHTLYGHKSAVLDVAVSPNNLVISSSSDRTLKVWDIRTGKLVASFYAEAQVISCASGPDDLTFVGGDENGRVHILVLE